MDSIFISYRRDDNADACARIYEWLIQVIPPANVFKDVYTIRLGQDFIQAIEGAVMKCQAMLVIVGPHWLGPDGLPSPYTRMEVELGLKHGLKVIPVMVGGATLAPAERLPESIRDFGYRNGITIHADFYFLDDMARLGSELKLPRRAVREVNSRLAGKHSPWKPAHQWIVAGTLVTLVGLVAVLIIRPDPANWFFYALGVDLLFAVPITAFLFLTQTIRRHQWLWLLIGVLSFAPPIIYPILVPNPPSQAYYLLLIPPIAILIYGWAGASRTLLRICLVGVLLLTVSTSAVGALVPHRPPCVGFSDTFANGISPNWNWNDPANDSTKSAAAGTGLTITAPPNHDLFPGINFNAPRLLQYVSGDFSVTTTVNFTPQGVYQGAGLLIWQDQENYVRLERGYGSAQGIEFDVNQNGNYRKISETGQAPTNATQTLLELVRQGDVIFAWYRDASSTGGLQSAGTVTFAIPEAQVGILVANHAGDLLVSANFSSFEFSCPGQ